MSDPLESTIPLYPQTPSEPATTQQINITTALNDSGNLVFMINNQSAQVDYNAPPLLLAASGNTSYPSDPQWNIYDFGSATSIRVVLRNFFPTVHPMHLHGHNPWILTEGLEN
ncbi:hypothetical protein MMC10_008585 [Thelotrema lepadinum]|nr:hypothetical protein [Thelotrema lepadinum]